MLTNEGIFSTAVAQTVTIDPVGNVTVVEGSDFTISCTDGVNNGAALVLRENDVLLTGISAPPAEVNDALRLIIYSLSVDRTKNGNTYYCESLITTISSEQIILAVICEWLG